MTLPTRIVINIVYLAFYVAILPFVLCNVIKHKGRREGFVYLVIFCLVRLVGNALDIGAYKDNYSSKDVFAAGLILGGLGYAFLFSAALAFYTRATKDPYSNDSGPKQGMKGIQTLLGRRNNDDTQMSARSQLSTILNFVNMVAMILLIVGYVKSNDLFTIPPSTNATLNSLARVGQCIYIALTLILAAIVIIFTISGQRPTGESSTLLYTIILALPIMLVRAIYVTYQTFQKDPFGQDVILRAVLQYAAEAMVELIYTIMGLYLLIHNQPGGRNDIELSGQQQR